MWVFMPIAFAGKLLSAFRLQLSYVWSSLVSLLLGLRAAFRLAGTESSRHQSRKAAAETRREEEKGMNQPPTPLSVNYHFTRQCNYKCGFCFHTAKTSFVLPLEDAKRGLLLLKEAGESLVLERDRSRPHRGQVAPATQMVMADNASLG